jgi:CheY-like chemotaxis protein/anti-sigma regulatory factor (Ser/Thr protein kinase)
MLDWTRLEARREVLPLQPVRLLPTLAATLACHAQQAAQRELKFVVDIDSALAAMADAARLQQVVDNLIANAIKFTAQGAVEIQAQTVGEHTEIRVRDSGPGLSAAQIARLFQPFERVGDERAAPGTGLGLAISYSLALRMGGVLRVESEPGNGSCFILTLAAAAPGADIEEAGESQSTVNNLSLHGLSLLLVEDDALARELMATELGARGAAVSSVPEALSALILLQQTRFDAALIDWDLPGMNGVDLARTLHQQHPQLVLIAVTGRTTPADQALSTDAGFAAHVPKPVDPQRLAATLVAVLR